LLLNEHNGDDAPQKNSLDNPFCLFRWRSWVWD